MLENKKKYLDTLIKNKIEKEKKRLESLENSYIIKNFIKNLNVYRNEIILREKELSKIFKISLERKRQEFNLKTEKIINLNPLSVLSRGYSITKKDNEILKETSSLKIGDEIVTNLYNGIIISEIKEIK